MRAANLINLLRRARSENRFDHVWLRIKNVIVFVFGQKRLLQEKFGIAHFIFFWGFVFYATTFWWSLIRGMFPILEVPYPDEIFSVAFVLDIFGTLVIVAVFAAIIRRVFFPPPRLEITFDAYFILFLISSLTLTFLFGEAFHVKSGVEEAVGPFGQLLASMLPAISIEAAKGLFVLMWWLHIAVVLIFLAYLPYSKHSHLLVAPFSVYFSSLLPAGAIATDENEELTTGSSKWEEFTWRQLLDGIACAECGRCDRQCPAQNSGYALSPKMVVHHIKEHLLESGLKQTKNGNGARKLIGDIVSEDEIWACTTCYACMATCPVQNEHIPLILQMRRHLIGEGTIDTRLQDTLIKLTRYGNAFGKSDRMRPQWSRELSFSIKDARKEPVEYLWYVGDTASFDTQLTEITLATAKIFDKAGLDFGILYESERNSGNDVRRVGEEGLFGMLQMKNLQALKRAKYKHIITTDPHTYNTLKNEYPLNGSSIKVFHYTEIIDQLIRERKLNFTTNSKTRVTYHDPCYLGRYNGIYDEPRRILKAIGTELVEMPRNRSRSYCCGAGGGQIWREDVPGIKDRPSENRIREAVALKDVHTFVVACPKDISMYRDAVKTTGMEDTIEIKDIAELVLNAIEG